jgi:hypothetical protein
MVSLLSWLERPESIREGRRFDPDTLRETYPAIECCISLKILQLLPYIHFVGALGFLNPVRGDILVVLILSKPIIP